MRLLALDPRWLTKDGKRIGFTFLCPCCLKNRLTCFNCFVPFKAQVEIMHRAMNTTPEDEHDWPINWVPSNSNAMWKLSNLTDFDTLTVHPSIDASASGNWHGWIKAGAIS